MSPGPEEERVVSFSEIVRPHLEEFRAHLQVKLARLGVTPDADHLTVLCYALGSLVRDPQGLLWQIHPVVGAPGFYEHAMEQLETAERDFADELAGLRAYVQQWQDDPAAVAVCEAEAGSREEARRWIQEMILALLLPHEAVEARDDEEDPT
jgi:hypothetical protein